MPFIEITKKYHETHVNTEGLSGAALEAVYMQRLERLDRMFQESLRVKALQKEIQEEIQEEIRQHDR
ncbi:MAG: hypothetical protein JKY80_04975 [Mariprofundaceae bacterium]|nr:hypothetical protein [Mariprofundaceae bacterium]